VIVIGKKRIAENLSNAFISGEKAPGNRRLFLMQTLCFKKDPERGYLFVNPFQVQGGEGLNL
jgi:hypothetical protein